MIRHAISVLATRVRVLELPRDADLGERRLELGTVRRPRRVERVLREGLVGVGAVLGAGHVDEHALLAELDGAAHQRD